MGLMLRLHNNPSRNAAMQQSHGWSSQICHNSEWVRWFSERFVNDPLPFCAKITTLVQGLCIGETDGGGS
jgi:hypothetical protein